MELALDMKNNLNSNIVTPEKQNSFLETTLGKTLNTAVNMGLRMVLPDLLENQIIEIKDTLLKEGLKEGLNTTIRNAIDLGKSAIGIFTGNFENINQVNSAVKKGGMIDSISKVIDLSVNKANEHNLIDKDASKLIKQGKNVLMDTLSKSIEDTLTNQIKSIEKIGTYCANWSAFYQSQDFENMDKEYNKLKKAIKTVLPLEETFKKAREIENLHNLIKNKGKNFNVSDEELNLAKRLAY